MLILDWTLNFEHVRFPSGSRLCTLAEPEGRWFSIKDIGIRCGDDPLEFGVIGGVLSDDGGSRVVSGGGNPSWGYPVTKVCRSLFYQKVVTLHTSHNQAVATRIPDGRVSMQYG